MSRTHERLVYAGVVVAAVVVAGVVLAPRLRERLVAGPPPEATAHEHVPEPEAPPPQAPKPTSAPPPPPPPEYVRENPESGRACAPGMLLVDGVYCPFVGHRCTSFLVEERDVCAKYAPGEVLCEGALQRRRYCIDRYEYPNLAGVVPAVMVDYNDALRGCAAEGKRLCTTEEWEFACEGPQMWPYPYGSDRDATACNIDRDHPAPDPGALSRPRRVSSEVERLDRRVASGAMPRCVSPFGVHDMTGNVDEWVENRNGKRFEKPYRSALKGGYWGPIRARCRPLTSNHSEFFSFYQVGFRCCADAGRPTVAAPR